MRKVNRILHKFFPYLLKIEKLHHYGHYNFHILSFTEMLFSSPESPCPGESDGVFDFILKLAEMAEGTLFLKFAPIQ